MSFKAILTNMILMIGLVSSTLVHAERSAIFDIAMKDAAGQPVMLKQFLGKKPIYLKFWASWCQDCLKQMPHLQHTYDRYSNDIEVISVNIGVNETKEAIEHVEETYSLTVPTLIDDLGLLAQALHLVGTPYHVLIDIDGNIVFKGHDASEQLDKTLKLLASSNSPNLPTLTIEETLSQQSLSVDSELTVLFFTSTWCDWYLEESRPAISKNCIAGQEQVNKLYQQTPDLNWLGVISHLWTGDKELEDYQRKYQVSYPLIIDRDNQDFVRFNVRTFPTLILLKAGNEVYRTSDFSEVEKISNTILNF